MGIVIGMDEAGYGPNLGPLVVSLTVWRVPGDPTAADFWTTFSPVVTQTSVTNTEQIQLADSKKIFSTAKGIASLERGVWCALQLLGENISSWNRLLDALTDRTRCVTHVEEWFAEADLDLPHEHDADETLSTVARWRDQQEESEHRLVTVKSDLMLTARWNELVRRLDNKGLALTQTSLELLRSVWSPASTEPTLIVADKHGGRNRYVAVLSEAFDGELFHIEDEGAASSRYRIGPHEIRFERQAERHLPVALASMFSKYLRELSMILFNRYWQHHRPDVKATAGYPEDAKRFLAAISATQVELGIPLDSLWRER
ncbi:MAG: hypothetical protein O2955_14920 [Planctomycetota bacterium]|nr:hypothetical protein [Planctomycetota bacterium]MDA1213806.1 hypothetical protein [Planctomycetota bacterium]